jgi:hypothetical protein
MVDVEFAELSKTSACTQQGYVLECSARNCVTMGGVAPQPLCSNGTCVWSVLALISCLRLLRVGTIVGSRGLQN